MQHVKKKKILVIANEKPTVSSLRAILRRSEYIILSATFTTLQSTAARAKKKPDAIIVDVPGERLNESVAALEKLFKVVDMPLVFLVERMEANVRAQIQRIESCEYIVKPYSEPELKHGLDIALYKHNIRQEIKEQRQWLHTTLRSIGDAVIATDKQGNVKFMNIIAESLTGWSEREAVGQKLTEVFVVINEETGQRLSNPVAKVLKERKPLGVTNHTILISKDGRRNYIEDSAAPIFDEENNISGVVLTFRNVTEKKRVQDALHRSEKRFRALIEKSAEAVSILDENGIIQYSTPSTTLMLGRDPQYYYGRSVFEFLHPDELEKTKRIFVDVVNNPGKSVLLQLRYLHKNNSWRWLEVAGTNLLNDPAVKGIVINFRDITYRKEAEERLYHINTRLNLLSRITGDIIGSLPVQKQIKDMAEQVKQAFSVDAVVVRIVEEGKLALLATAGIAPESMPQSIPLREGIAEQILTTHRAVAYKNVEEHFAEYYNSLQVEQKPPFDIISYAGAPLIIGHAIIGIIGLFTTTEYREFTSTDLEHLQVVGNHIAVAVSNDSLFKEVREQNLKLKQQIDEQLHVEQLLRHSEDRYKAFVEQSSEGIYRTAFTEPISLTLPIEEQIRLMFERGYIAECNAVMAKMYGFSSIDEAIGVRIKELLVPGDPYNIDYMREFIHSGYKFFDKESHELDKNGVNKFFLNNGIGIIDEGYWHGVWGTQRDITERKLAEAALRESEERYRALVEYSPNAIAVHVNGVVRFANRAAIQLMGAKSLEELIGTDVMSYVHPEYRDIAQKRIAKVYENEAVPPLEQKWVRFDGSTVDVEVVSIPFLYEGTPAAQIIARNNTERKRAEDALRESELRFRSLFENAKDAVFIYDTKTGVIIDANAEAEKLLKRSRSELIGTHQTQIHPQERIDEALSLFREQMLTLGEQPVEFEVVDAYGKRIPVEIKSSLIRIDEHRIVSQGIFRDITERKLAEEALRRSEEKYRALFEGSKDGIYISTYFGKFIDVNPAMVELLGYKSKEEVLALDIKHDVYFNPKDRDKFRLAITNRSFVKDLEISLRRKDGSEINVLLTSTVERGGDGTALFYSGSVRDITERKRLEEQLIQAQKMESIGTLAGGIAHDFNNLLAMILGTAELIKNKTSDNRAIQTYINRIIEASDRGASISKQLLLFSRPEQAELQPLFISTLLEQLHEFLSHFLPKNITVQCSVADKTAVMMGDSGHLHQAVVNLALNAKDAMPEGGVLTLTESVVNGSTVRKRFPQADDHDYIAIGVHDTGMGMESQLLQRIFEPFFSTKSRDKGTGLGLSIVHGIVKLHHGYIHVESEKGRGTEFTMYFPSLIMEVTEEQNLKSTMTEQHNETILIVDDEEMLREILAESLADEGYNVLLAADGYEALTIFAKRQKDISLVITDLGMPNMNGTQLFEKLTTIKPDIKVVISSGFLDVAKKSELLNKGIKGVLTKPYKFDAIFTIIRKVLYSEQE